MATKKAKRAQRKDDGLSAAERSEKMRALALARPKLSTEDFENLAWLRTNRGRFDNMLVDRYGHPPIIYDDVISADEPADRADETTANNLSPELSEALNEALSTLPNEADLAALDAHTATQNAEFPARVPIDSCLICGGPIYDLDSRCESCVDSGRLAAVAPAAGSPAAIAELRAAQESIAPPPTTALPRYDNAIKRAPVPPPLPPARAYQHSETCRGCGRLQELHQSHGGPISAGVCNGVFQAQA